MRNLSYYSLFPSQIPTTITSKSSQRPPLPGFSAIARNASVGVDIFVRGRRKQFLNPPDGPVSILVFHSRFITFQTLCQYEASSVESSWSEILQVVWSLRSTAFESWRHQPCLGTYMVLYCFPLHFSAFSPSSSLSQCVTVTLPDILVSALNRV